MSTKKSAPAPAEAEEIVRLDLTQLTAARSYMAGFSTNAIRKGSVLCQRHLVENVVFIRGDEDVHFLATFSALAGFCAVDLFYNRGWKGECDCEIGSKCKHCYAAMQSVIEFGGIAVNIDDLDEERAPTVSFAAPPKQSTVSKKAAGFQAKVAAQKPPPPPEPFKVLLEEKLGRDLASAEAKIAKLISNVFDQHRTKDKVPESAIAEIYGPPMPWSWNLYELWPKPPADPWQTWLYVAHFLEKTSRPWPPFLAQITPQEELEAVIDPWLWSLEVDRWTKELQASERTAVNPAEAPIDLRVVFWPDGAALECRQGEKDWAPMKRTRYEGLKRTTSYGGAIPFTPEGSSVWAAFSRSVEPALSYRNELGVEALNLVLRNPLLAPRVLTSAGEPFRREETPLRWVATSPASEKENYLLSLALPDGTKPPAAMLVLNGEPALYVTRDAIYQATPLGRLKLARATTAIPIPAPALETAAGVAVLEAAGVGLPPSLAERIERRVGKLVIEAALGGSPYGGTEEYLRVRFLGEWDSEGAIEHLSADGWTLLQGKKHPSKTGSKPPDRIVSYDRSLLRDAGELARDLHANWSVYNLTWERRVTKKFPEEFGEWLLTVPPHVELRLDPLLASFRDHPITASVRLDVEPVGVDWFDLTVALDLPELEFTPDELSALLSAKGGWVRLGAKGWRRLALQLSEDEDRSLADLGLSPRDLTGGEKQRLHALQLSQAGANRLLPPDRVDELRNRVHDLKARVSPAIPAEITADLRPYQVEGFHFLAYLSTNRFGGLLADDMGLGKTIQTLTWLTWLRTEANVARALLPAGPEGNDQPIVRTAPDERAGVPASPQSHFMPSLVVCPKSVMDNWSAEALRFAPHLRVKMWSRGTTETLADAAKTHDLLVLNYTQLRLLEDELVNIPWLAVILDEAQAIKNPDSQTTRAACALRADHRLALSGTPIENRLLDLWSIMSFTMPGILGQRARFARTYDQKDDPLARRRLAARTRPFVLRRTKEQVARDLPARVEEELLCEMEGRQAILYRAELKRARQELLKLKTAKELDGARFHILTSLLRLRQICCHPGLVEAESIDKPSAKLEALLELLEPLIEEGRKVLVFSQFVGVIEILQKAMAEKNWPHFILTGQTEDRGELIQRFQNTQGSAVFLLSLKASGFGLNLTAASYVVLYDPWWNPAVENQAIDRTHRIGQTNTVFAYRLLVKGSIEEKIRVLQKQKSALAEDILGEESFARALTLDDLKLLLAE